MRSLPVSVPRPVMVSAPLSMITDWLARASSNFSAMLEPPAGVMLSSSVWPIWLTATRAVALRLAVPLKPLSVAVPLATSA